MKNKGQIQDFMKIDSCISHNVTLNLTVVRCISKSLILFINFISPSTALFFILKL